MSDQYLGEIRPTGFNFAPYGWALCQGQLLAVSQYSALFSLLGVQFGGNGTTNFALPNLNGASPIGAGSGGGLTSYVVGDAGGATSVAIDQTQMPSHSHAPAANSAGSDQTTPKGNIWSAEFDNNGGGCNSYVAPPANVQLPFTDVLPTGQSPAAPLSISQPTQAVNYIIALQGNFPQRS